jgi:hypothetical protein
MAGLHGGLYVGAGIAICGAVIGFTALRRLKQQAYDLELSS